MAISRFYLANIRTLLVWPAIAAVLAALLWLGIHLTLKNEKMRVEQHASELVASLSRGYAEQLQRNVEQIDQLTLSLKYDWEDPAIPLDLERQRKKGLYPPDTKLYAAIVGRDGYLVTSSVDLPGRPDFSEAHFFQFHREFKSDELRIHPPALSSRLQESVIRFSRRLDRPDGTFDGVAWVAVEPDYLLAFYDESRLREGDFTSVRFTDGPLLAAKLGGAARLESIYQSDPVFDEPFGVVEEPKEKFKDNQARLVAWKRIDDYPLVAVTGVSTKNILAPYSRLAQKYRQGGFIASMMLALIAIIGTFQSVRLARRKEEKEQAKSIFRLAVDGAREGFYTVQPVYDAGGEMRFHILDCNERGARMLGRTRAELIGADFSAVFASDHTHKVGNFFRRALADGFHEDEMRVPANCWIKAAWIHRKAVRSGTGLAMTVRDISERKAHEQELSNMANADALTSLPNRHWLNNFLPLAIERARDDGTCLAVLFIDLDNFKNINDTLGHHAGDELLKSVAARLRAVVRTNDHAVRLGGDEFTVVLEQVFVVEDVVRVAKAIVNALGEPFTLAGTAGHRIQASIGISMSPHDGQDSETLLKHADIAMYAAKAAGKGRYYFYQAHLSDSLMLKIGKEEALRHAIEHDQFILHYQPRVNARTGRMSSMEALVRWNHPERGIVPPLEFVPMAEDTRLILKLGEMVIEKACAQIAQWKAQGLPPVSVSINVSALQFNEGQVESILRRAMVKYSIEPELIGVELTESCMVAEGEKVPRELEAVRSLGVKLLVDDFGTGYSSLAQLQRLDVDILKVDRAFTLGLQHGEEGKAFFKAIVSMADALDMCVVAEGVETKEQLTTLQSLSCDEVQGNFISAPVPAKDMAALILKRFLLPPELSKVA
ncbi:GGDEF and EAL domain-containing protein [Herbaspirillum sp. HC18]|nr:GGDEF and EAL domain-containing protein [Herbaspirillum sp. HC18]